MFISGQSLSNLDIPQSVQHLEISDSIIAHDIKLPDSMKCFKAYNSQIYRVHLSSNIQHIDIQDCKDIKLAYTNTHFASLESIKISNCGLKSFDITGPRLRSVDLTDNQIQCIYAKWGTHLKHLDISGNPPNICIKHLEFLLDAEDNDFPKGDYFSVLTRGEFTDPGSWPWEAYMDLRNGNNKIYNDLAFGRFGSLKT